MSNQATQRGTDRSILFLLDSGAIGGGPRNVIAAARGLCAHGWRCVAICGDDGPLADDLTSIGVATTALPIAGKYHFLLAFPALVQRLRRERPAIVLVYGPIAASIGGLAARLAGIRHIVYHAGYPSYYADHDPVRRVRNAAVERVACSCASIVWCVSTLDKKMYAVRQKKVATKLRVVPLCVAQDLLDRFMEPSAQEQGAALRVRLGLSPDDSVVAFVGRLVPEKGVDILLEAWSRVQRTLPGARLVITGDGSERRRLEQLANELHIAEQVIFVGAQRDIVPYYLLADVVAIPSRYEPGGTVAMEAMAAGKPVVATRVHAFTDTIIDGECGRLVPAEDAKALADGLLWVLQSGDHAHQLGTRAQERALAEYTEERMAERLNHLLADELHIR